MTSAFNASLGGAAGRAPEPESGPRALMGIRGFIVVKYVTVVTFPSQAQGQGPGGLCSLVAFTHEDTSLTNSGVDHPLSASCHIPMCLHPGSCDTDVSLTSSGPGFLLRT